MSTNRHIELKFERIGAQASVRQMTKESFKRHGRPMLIDVLRSQAGEHFEIERTNNVELAVLDVQPRQRHLLLMAENGIGSDQFLCGHDERHWFIASLPEDEQSRTVHEAKESLKPKAVRRKERRKRGKRRRKSDVYIRQGEWFFVPCPNACILPGQVLRNAPLVRGPGSTPHMCERMFLDGEPEYECDRYPKLAFFESEYKHILKTRRKSKQWKWRRLPFDPDIYVRGWITHTDHNPLHLDEWHFVQMNTERVDSSLVKVVYFD